MTTKPEAKKYRELWASDPSKYKSGIYTSEKIKDRDGEYIDFKQTLFIEKQAYDDLKAQADALHFQIREVYEDYYRHIDKHDIPVTKEYTECISYLSNALKTYENFKKRTL